MPNTKDKKWKKTNAYGRIYHCRPNEVEVYVDDEKNEIQIVCGRIDCLAELSFDIDRKKESGD